MSNSPLVSYVRISPHRNSPRKYPITKITIHHAAGNVSLQGYGNTFQTRQASANYGIDSQGNVGMYVEEKDRSWASSSSDNDNRAVTIEVANSSTGGNWPVSDAALAKLIELCVDICKRNGIARLNYTGDASGNLTRHNMFKNTTCPGPYLQAKFPWIAEQVNARLGASASAPAPKPAPAASSGYTGNSIVEYLNSVRQPSSYSARQKLASQHGISGYKGTSEQNLTLLGILRDGKTAAPAPAPTPAPAPAKSISKMADEVIAGLHGNGHDTRRKSLGISDAEYEQVRAEVNRRAGVTSAGVTSKSIDQMAREVIAGKHGNGHADRQKSLGVSTSVYAKVRKRVNELLR